MFPDIFEFLTLVIEKLEYCCIIKRKKARRSGSEVFLMVDGEKQNEKGHFGIK